MFKIFVIQNIHVILNAVCCVLYLKRNKKEYNIAILFEIYRLLIEKDYTFIIR